MFFKYIKIILVIILSYQTPLYSKSISFDDFNSKNLSKYFSGIVAFENKDNSTALNFFDSSKILLNRHDTYLKRYINSLVLENKVSKAINIIKSSKDNKNPKFFNLQLLLIIDSIKKGNFDEAYIHSVNASNSFKSDRFNARTSLWN